MFFAENTREREMDAVKKLVIQLHTPPVNIIDIFRWSYHEGSSQFSKHQTDHKNERRTDRERGGMIKQFISQH